AQPGHDVGGHDGERAGIEREMRIAGRVDVAQRAVDGAGAYLQDGEAPHRLDDAGRAAEQPRVAAALDDRVDPRVFVEAVAHQDLGSFHQHELARSDLQVVRVLSGARRHPDLTQVAYDRARDRPQVGQGGQHTQA